MMEMPVILCRHTVYTLLAHAAYPNIKQFFLGFFPKHHPLRSNNNIIRLIDFEAFLYAVPPNTSNHPVRWILSRGECHFQCLLLADQIVFLHSFCQLDTNSVPLHLCNFSLKSFNLFVSPHLETSPSL